METEPEMFMSLQPNIPAPKGDHREIYVVTDSSEVGKKNALSRRKHVTALILPRFQAPSDKEIDAESELGWTKKSPPNYVERAHALLGMTVDQGRVRDIISLQKALKGDTPKRTPKWRFAGHGQAGVVAAYAALLDPTIEEIVIINPPITHKDGPHFLNVTRVLDVPEALGMLAPRKLTLIGADPKKFARTAKIYEIAGAKKNLIFK